MLLSFVEPNNLKKFIKLSNNISSNTNASLCSNNNKIYN